LPLADKRIRLLMGAKAHKQADFGLIVEVFNFDVM
jgi:hypothetical protein